MVTDGDGGTSAPATRAIALAAVNDAPVLAGIEPGALAYTENAAATAVTLIDHRHGPGQQPHGRDRDDRDEPLAGSGPA